MRAIISTIALFILVLGFSGAAIEAKADIVTWNYEDDFSFSTQKATVDSYDHSIFWPELALPPGDPYLFYTSVFYPPDMLGFAEFPYTGEDAYLAYAFPLDNIMTRIDSGTFELDILFSDSNLANPYLFYELSEDGINWTESIPLVEGNNQISLLASDYQQTYFKLIGTDVAIDNLSVTVYGPEIPEPVTIALFGLGLPLLKRSQLNRQNKIW